MLSNILADTVAATGYKVTSDDQRLRVVSLINDAAFELWNSGDLPNCLGEQIFQLGTTDQQITLPYYVQDIRAIRNYDSRLKMQNVDMRPRYGTMGWVDYAGYSWKTKQQEAPLAKDLLNVEPITFTLPQAAPESFSINLEIRTPKAARTNETIVFAVGDTTKTSVSLIEEVYSITKSVMTTYDVTMLNQLAEELGIIPNGELKSSYTLINVLEMGITLGQVGLVEVLYKRNFPKFFYDTDRFPCGDKYDKAIFYKAMEIYYGTQQGQEASAKALSFFQKCQDYVKNITITTQEGKALKIDFGPNRWRRLPERSWSTWNQGVGGVGGGSLSGGYF